MKIKSKTILLADDMETEEASGLKRSQKVKECATELAKKLNSSIEIVHIEDLTMYPVAQPYYREYIQTFISQKKYNLKKVVNALGVPVRASLLEGYPVEILTKLTSKRNEYELLALGSHGRRGLKRAILGSVAEDVVRNSKIPVLILGPHAQTQKQRLLTDNPIKILIATDLGENGKKAEDYAISLAKRLPAEIVLFHSVFAGFHPGIGPAFSTGSSQNVLYGLSQKIRPKIIREIEGRVKKIQKLGIGCSNYLDETSLTASSGILSQIEKIKPSLIVMGTHGRSLFSGALLGSNTREMILSSPLPIIVIRSR